jgi:hypothetical protein
VSNNLPYFDDLSDVVYVGDWVHAHNTSREETIDKKIRLKWENSFGEDYWSGIHPVVAIVRKTNRLGSWFVDFETARTASTFDERRVMLFAAIKKHTAYLTDEEAIKTVARRLQVFGVE